MIVRTRLSAASQTTGYEYLIRFVLGGAATVVTGLVAQIGGPEYGGLFLAFPAIFCASATLIEKHEEKRKQRKGMRGSDRGKSAAALDAAGAAMGAIGLMAFGAVIWLLTGRLGLAALVAASFVWALVSCLLWAVRQWTPRILRHPNP